MDAGSETHSRSTSCQAGTEARMARRRKSSPPVRSPTFSQVLAATKSNMSTFQLVATAPVLSWAVMMISKGPETDAGAEKYSSYYTQTHENGRGKTRRTWRCEVVRAA